MSEEPTSFLYPFIDSEERDEVALVADLSRSAATKMAESRRLGTLTIERSKTDLQRAGREMAERFRLGGRLFAFGNGGSATDAAGMVDLFLCPPSGTPLPALALVDDRAVLTALANDVGRVGYDLVFSRQIIAHARSGDIVVGFSTSGGSVNVLNAFDEAAKRGILTLGFAGYGGGSMATSSSLDHRLVVGSDSVHRIQEVQSALVLELWSMVQQGLRDGEGQ